MYHLTRTGRYMLRVTLEDWDGNTAYAGYSGFHISDEQDQYRLHYDRFLGGSAGDSFGSHWTHTVHHRDQTFSTPDRDNDAFRSGSCAVEYNSGWWFTECIYGNLNGLYRTSPNIGSWYGVEWFSWKSQFYSYKSVAMKIRHSG